VRRARNTRGGMIPALSPKVKGKVPLSPPKWPSLLTLAGVGVRPQYPAPTTPARSLR